MKEKDNTKDEKGLALDEKEDDNSNEDNVDINYKLNQ